MKKRIITLLVPAIALLVSCTKKDPTNTNDPNFDALKADTIVAGGLFGTLIRPDGTIKALGYLGTGADGQTGIACISAGTSHLLLVKTDGTVWGTGGNTSGELGDSTLTGTGTLVQVHDLTNVIRAAAGGNHSLALRSDGTVWAWGANTNGQLGNGTTTDTLEPVQVPGLTGITAISAGLNYSLALKSDGTVWAWGSNSTGQCGVAASISETVPVQVTTVANIQQISAGGTHALALTTSGVVYSWGGNTNGQLGNGTTSTSATLPALVPLLASSVTTAISAGGTHSLTLRSDGKIICWGNNTSGQVTESGIPQRPTPIILSLENIAKIAAGYDFSYCIGTDGTVWGWGNNATSQMGTASGLSGTVYAPTKLPNQ